MVSAVKAVKSFINSEIAGPAGPSKAYRSEPPPPPRSVQVRACPASGAFPSHPQCTPAVYNVTVGCAGLMGLPAAGKDRCILVTFGTRPADGAATYRVRHLMICMTMHVCVCIACMSMYLFVSATICIYVYVFSLYIVCMCMYLPLCVCMCMYFL